MKLCSTDHDEVCYDGRECPACSVAEVKDREIDSLTDKVHGLESELADAKAEIDDLKAE